MKSKSKFSRYNLRGDIMWCLDWRNGWVRIYNTMIRWNTDWTTNYRYFSVERMRRKFPYDGPAMVSTGSRVGEWTARQAMIVNQAKQIFANDELYAMAA